VKSHVMTAARSRYAMLGLLALSAPLALSVPRAEAAEPPAAQPAEAGAAPGAESGEIQEVVGTAVIDSYHEAKSSMATKRWNSAKPGVLFGRSGSTSP